MCRLALLNKAGVDYIEKSYGLKAFFDFLEKSRGGDGNGFAVIGKNGELTKLRKGVKLSNEEIAREILSEADLKWVIYHTRLASCGTVGDENCHPFLSKDEKIVLAANGTEHALKLMAKRSGRNITDSRMILDDFLDGDDSFYEDLHGWNSALIGCKNGKAFAVRNQRSLERLYTGGDEVIIASEFPFGGENKKQIEEYIEEEE